MEGKDKEEEGLVKRSVYEITHNLTCYLRLFVRITLTRCASTVTIINISTSYTRYKLG